MKWAVCEKFHHWLRGHRFTAWTDNNPLTYILSKAKLDVREQRWVTKLAPYQFDIKYIPGPKNIVADALSREPFVHPSMLHRLTRVAYEMLFALMLFARIRCRMCFGSLLTRLRGTLTLGLLLPASALLLSGLRRWGVELSFAHTSCRKL